LVILGRCVSRVRCVAQCILEISDCRVLVEMSKCCTTHSLYIADDADGQNCTFGSTDAKEYGKHCVQPWTNLSAWDPVVVSLASTIRNDSTPSYQGSLHPRIKSPIGHRLAQAYTNLFKGGLRLLQGPLLRVSRMPTLEQSP